MTRRPRLGKYAIMLMASCAFGFSASPNDAVIDAYRDKLQKELERHAEIVSAERFKIEAAHLERLNVIRKTVQQEGDLDKTTALLAEMQQFEKTGAVPDKTADLAEISAARRAYLTRAEQLAKAAEGNLKKLLSHYDRALNRIQTQSVKDGDLKAAQLVRNERLRAASLAPQAPPDKREPTTVTSTKAKPSDESLALHLVFDEQLSDEIRDRSSNARNGQLRGGATLAHDGDARALQLRKPGAHLHLGAGDLPPPWTAAFWLRVNDNSGARCLLDSNRYSIRVSFDGQAKVGLTAYGVKDAPFPYELPLKRWTHVVFATDGDSTTLYVDGTEISKQPMVINCPLATLGGASDSVHGQIREVKVWSRRLPENEIAAVPNAHK